MKLYRVSFEIDTLSDSPVGAAIASVKYFGFKVDRVVAAVAEWGPNDIFSPQSTGEVIEIKRKWFLTMETHGEPPKTIGEYDSKEETLEALNNLLLDRTGEVFTIKTDGAHAETFGKYVSALGFGYIKVDKQWVQEAGNKR